MKKQFFFFALLLAGMFSFQTVNAQHGLFPTYTVPSQWQGKTLTGTTPVHGYVITIKFTEIQGTSGPNGKKVATMKIGNNEYNLRYSVSNGISYYGYIFTEHENGKETGRNITLEEKANGSVGFTRTNTDGVTVNSTTTLTIQ